MDPTKIEEALTKWKADTDEYLTRVQRALAEDEKKLRAEIAVAHKFPSDLLMAKEATHALVGVGNLYGSHGGLPRKIALTVDHGSHVIELGEINLPADNGQRATPIPYRAIVLLFREGA